jgi:hypothetical protein
MIVLEDADIGKAVGGAERALLSNAGQLCIAIEPSARRRQHRMRPRLAVDAMRRQLVTGPIDPSPAALDSVTETIWYPNRVPYRRMSGRVRRQGTPFPFEGPVPPELLIDREDELALVGRRAGDRVDVRLVAPRRYGKTSLLLAHAAQLQQVGWRTVHVDLYGIADYTDVARRVATAYGHLDAPWMRSHLSGLLGRLGVTMSATGPTVTLAARPSATPDAAAAETVLERLLDLPVTLFEHDGCSTLVVFDEFQELLVARRDLDGLLRSRIQYHGDAAAYVFAGSEPSMMRELFESRDRPFFGQADPLALGPLRPEQTIADLAARFEQEGLDGGEALGHLVVFAGGHPQRTMLLAYLLADRLAAGQPATPALADAVIADALQRTAPAHQALWQQLGPFDRAVLAAVADGVAPTSRALAAEHRVSRKALDTAADRLADQGHLLRLSRGAQLIDPLLAEWLRRR